MTLPEIPLPKVEIPFDIPVLMHPPLIHFLIAIPVVILLLEVFNLVIRKRAVGVVSFFLLILTIAAAIGAYITGLTDGKEAFPALNEVAKAALGEHKQLGAYILVGSVFLLVLKLLSMIGNKFLKALYILILVLFIAVIFKQGKEGGDLVYKHGLNVQQVKTLDDSLFDLKEEMEELQEDFNSTKSKLKETQESQKEVAKAVVAEPVVVATPVVEEVAKIVETKATPIVEEVTKELENTVAEATASVTKTVESTVTSAVKEVAKTVENAVVTPEVKIVSDTVEYNTAK